MAPRCFESGTIDRLFLADNLSRARMLPMFDLANYLPYLINRTGVRVAAKFARDVRPRDISVQDWRVLASLTFYGPQRMSDLAERTSIDRTTLSRLVARMQSSGLLRRERTEDDGREVRIVMSAQGEAAARAIIPLAQRYEDVALEGFSPEETTALKAMLHRVYANLEKL